MPTLIVIGLRDTSKRDTVLGPELKEFARRIGELPTCVKDTLHCQFDEEAIRTFEPSKEIPCTDVCHIPGAVCGAGQLPGYGRQPLMYNTIAEVNGYLQRLDDFGEAIARQRYVSKDSRSTLVVLEGSNPKCSNKEIFYPLSDWLNEQLYEVFDASEFEVGLTSWSEQMRATANGAVKDASSAHIFTLPIAWAILFGTVGPTAAFVIFTMPISLLSTLYILVPLQKTHGGPYSWAHISPGMWISILVAMSIDYALFLLSRWREERLQGRSKLVATVISVQTAGKTVFLSGVILAMSFFSLIIIDTELVKQVGASCGILILVTMAVNMSLIPALLIIMPDFKCCYVRNKYLACIRARVATTIIRWTSEWPWLVACVRTCISDVDHELAQNARGEQGEVAAYNRLEMKSLANASFNRSGSFGISGSFTELEEDEEKHAYNDDHDFLNNSLEDTKYSTGDARVNLPHAKKSLSLENFGSEATRIRRSNTLDTQESGDHILGIDNHGLLDSFEDQGRSERDTQEEAEKELNLSGDQLKKVRRPPRAGARLVSALSGAAKGGYEKKKRRNKRGKDLRGSPNVTSSLENASDDVDETPGGLDAELEGLDVLPEADDAMIDPKTIPPTPGADLRIPAQSIWVKIALMCRRRPLAVILMMVVLGAPLSFQCIRMEVSSNFEQMLLSQSPPVRAMREMERGGFTVGLVQKHYLVITLGPPVSLMHPNQTKEGDAHHHELDNDDHEEMRDRRERELHCIADKDDKETCTLINERCWEDDPDKVLANHNQSCPRVLSRMRTMIMETLPIANNTRAVDALACAYDPHMDNKGYPEGFTFSYICPKLCGVACNSTASSPHGDDGQLTSRPTPSPTVPPPPPVIDEEYNGLFECGDDTGGWINKISPCVFMPGGQELVCVRKGQLNCQLAGAILNKKCDSNRVGTRVGAGGQHKDVEESEHLVWGHVCADTCNMCPFDQKIFTRDIYSNLTHVVRRILGLHPPAGTQGARTISFMDGQALPYETALSLLNETRPGVNDTGASGIARAYRHQVRRVKSMLGSAAIIELTPSFNSAGAKSAKWTDHMREMIDDETEKSKLRGVEWSMHFLGISPIVADLRDQMYESAPYYMTGAVVAVVILLTAFSFQSLTMGIRLLVTVAFSLSWVYGLMVVLLQDIAIPGSQQDGMHFIVPIIITPALVGLTLDYDLFLLVRIHEYRLEGYSTQDATMAAMYKTSGIITVAGMIMLAAFSALISSQLFMLRIIGMLVTCTCLIDTFLVRAWLVPALLMIGVEWNWWPGKVPPVTKRCRVEGMSSV
eukprot:CAMPEP_0184493164 /NCGR_PEP_ID=MMETSP0113_2-20130426/25278_1 /TAXON_ID=91329 /ORGANISM="Norrisiella sphaerica, Strain BC52" /LENGTH=1300 /DNA_ID=CAMNT_0026878333 /DNA_START=331 /DNA_END=4233 /DNA_ORIENTATION=+